MRNTLDAAKGALLLSLMLRALAAVGVVIACLVSGGCASLRAPYALPDSPVKHSVRVPPRGIEATVTAEDRRAILKLASAELSEARLEGFGNVRPEPVTTSEAKRTVLGEIEIVYHIVPRELAASPSLFSALRVTGAVVPVMLDGSRLEEMYVVRDEGRWAYATTGSWLDNSDRSREQLVRKLGSALGGSPNEARDAHVTGSLWVIARRGDREVAGLLTYQMYRKLGDTSVELPSEGSVLTSDEFRTLLARMKP